MNKFTTILVVTLLMGLSGLKAQTNIGSPNAPDASAQLQISSTTLGVMLPKVALTATTTFTLTGNTKSAGMVVYNTNAAITGTTAYPAYGTGLYTWDGTGWKGTPAVATFPQMVLVAYGALSAQIPSSTALDISKVDLNTGGKITTTSTSLTFNVAGTFKIDAFISCSGYSGGSSIDAFLYKNSTTTALVGYGVYGGNGWNASIPIIYIGTFAAGDIVTFGGQVGGGAGGGMFQVISLQIQQIK